MNREINLEALTMEMEMVTPPQLLQQFAGKESCCIFRVPHCVLQNNREEYQPRIVSIGPYHHGNKDLEMIQQHKWRYLQGFLTRTGKPLASFLNCIMLMENDIRRSYSESLERICSNSLANMMVLDGVFLIELFRKSGGLISTQDDPIFKVLWVCPFLMRDLLRIENQIPYFVLQKLFDESQTKTDDRKLSSLILEFFNYAVHRPKEVLQQYKNLEGKHLLDFFRKSFIRNSASSNGNEMPDNPSLKLIQPATKLAFAGVRFKENHKASSFLDIEFRKGVLSIPRINIDNFYTCFFSNAVAFEQCYSECSKDITTYVVFLGCLIHNSTDVGLLSKVILENYFGTDKKLVKFFNNVGEDVTFDIKDNYLKRAFKDVNEYCNNGWHVGWARFKHKYVETPWVSLSLLTALVLLLVVL